MSVSGATRQQLFFSKNLICRLAQPPVTQRDVTPLATYNTPRITRPRSTKMGFAYGNIDQLVCGAFTLVHPSLYRYYACVRTCLKTGCFSSLTGKNTAKIKFRRRTGANRQCLRTWLMNYSARQITRELYRCEMPMHICICIKSAQGISLLGEYCVSLCVCVFFFLRHAR